MRENSTYIRESETHVHEKFRDRKGYGGIYDILS